MKKKMMISLTAAIVLSLMVAAVVIAGATRDRGTLETEPPPGKVNWTAWLRVYLDEDDEGIVTWVHPPNEIMTEDGFNAAQGTGLGYTADGWQIQVENFLDKATNIRVMMNFCGLEGYEGDNWHKWFNWDLSTSTTDHGEVPLRTTTSFTAPFMLPVEAVGGTNIIKFTGSPNTTYQVYRSQNPAFLGADRSNGRYMLVGPSTTNSSGYGEYFDNAYNPDFPTWYVVMYFAETWNGLHGCHSRNADPTSVRVFDFNAVYQPETHTVDLAWQTASDSNIRGFNILRSTSTDGQRVKLNDKVIIAEPGMMEASYAFTDEELGDAQTYYYWVEIVEFEGRTEPVGPVSVTIENNRGGFNYFLPLTFK